jgi:opacity protein-like surface antigen
MNIKKAITLTALVAAAGIAAGAAQAQLYWRVDSGYSWSKDAGISDKNFPLNGIICGNAACTVPGQLNDLDNSLILGAGVGYRFDPNLRGDVTLGYRGYYKLRGVDAGVPATSFSADVKSWLGLLNGYYDFPVGGSWMPYLGAGIGFARNKVDSVTGTGGGITASVPGGTKTEFAWALMAGVSYPLNAGMTLDIGYRYLDAGRAETDFGAVSPAVFGTYSGASGKLRAHELAVGLRF